jgi:hypothetical protein
MGCERNGTPVLAGLLPRSVAGQATGGKGGIRTLGGAFDTPHPLSRRALSATQPPPRGDRRVYPGSRAATAGRGRLGTARRDAGVVDRSGLENRKGRQALGGSNPSPSAKSPYLSTTSSPEPRWCSPGRRASPGRLPTDCRPTPAGKAQGSLRCGRGQKARAPVQAGAPTREGNESLRHRLGDAANLHRVTGRVVGQGIADHRACHRYVASSRHQLRPEQDQIRR